MKDGHGFNLRLVKAVQSQPSIWNASHPHYLNRAVVESAWAQVASQAADSVPACKIRWKNLRSVFVRHMNKSTKSQKDYYLWNAMQFIVPNLRRRAVYPEEMIKDEEFKEYDREEKTHFLGWEEKMEADELPSVPQWSTEVADQQFLLSLAPDMASMTPIQKRQFKGGVIKLLQSICDDQVYSPGQPMQSP